MTKSEWLVELAGTIGGLGLFTAGIIICILKLIFEVQWRTLLTPWDYYGCVTEYIFEWLTVFIYLICLTFCILMSLALILHWLAL
jgi:hypothetical protein